MKVKLGNIVLGLPSLKELLGYPVDMDVSYKIASIAIEYDKHYNAFTKAKESLIDKYGMNTKEGRTLDPKHQTKAEKEVAKTFDIDIEFDSQKISLSWFKGMKIKPQIWVDLYWLTEE